MHHDLNLKQPLEVIFFIIIYPCRVCDLDLELIRRQRRILPLLATAREDVFRRYAQSLAIEPSPEAPAYLDAMSGKWPAGLLRLRLTTHRHWNASFFLIRDPPDRTRHGTGSGSLAVF